MTSVLIFYTIFYKAQCTYLCKMFDFLHHILGEKTQPKTSQIALVQKQQQQELSALSKIETGKGNAPSQHSALKQSQKTTKNVWGWMRSSMFGFIGQNLNFSKLRVHFYIANRRKLHNYLLPVLIEIFSVQFSFWEVHWFDVRV